MPISLEVVQVVPTDQVVINVAVDPGLVVCMNYEYLTNKPKINGVELIGDKSALTLGLAYTYETRMLRQWVSYLSNLVGRIPLYSDSGVFINKWAAVVGIDDGAGVYNIKVDDADVIDTPAIPATLTEPTE